MKNKLRQKNSATSVHAKSSIAKTTDAGTNAIAAKQTKATPMQANHR